MSLHNLRLELEPSPAVLESVNSVLRKHNQNANTTFWNKLAEPANTPNPLNVIAYDNEGEVVGGLLAETSFLWLKLQILSVREELRGHGLGSQLVRRAESEACSRGCKYSFVDTMDYQAPDFFRRLGYDVAGTIPDWDSHEHTKYFLTKSIAANSLE